MISKPFGSKGHIIKNCLLLDRGTLRVEMLHFSFASLCELVILFKITRNYVCSFDETK